MKNQNAWIIGGIVILIVILIPMFFVPLAARQSTAVPGSASFASTTPSMMDNLNYEFVQSNDDATMTQKTSIFPDEYPSAGETAAEVDQKIIKTGYLNMEVTDVSESAGVFTALATGKGGFVQSSEVNEREDGTHFGNITIRVPSLEFENTMTEIKKLATVVKSESASGQDVTEQFTDLEAQLKNAEAQETELLVILKRAESVEDVLAVQRELFQVRATIESLQGQIKYLENITTYSTIAVSLSEESTLRVPSKDFRPLSTIREASQALFSLVQRSIEGLIYLVIIGGGILLPFGLIVWGIVKVIQRRHR